MARLTFLGLVTALSLFSMVPTAKAASIASCGDINVEASAQCKVETGVECEANCTPINCSASLYATCQGGCNITPPSCDVSCSGTCEGQCTGNANFDCSGNCTVTCGGTCDSKCTAHCQNDANQATCVADCKASCTATCQGECDASCNANVSGTCSGKCQASCQGSCNASARIDCQANCQATGYVDCTGGCKAACQRTGQGGLFCDSQYVDDGNNLQNCINAIQDALHITVDASATGNCSGNSCQGEAKASASCALARLGEKKGLAGGLMILAAAGLVIGVRRRRRE